MQEIALLSLPDHRLHKQEYPPLHPVSSPENMEKACHIRPTIAKDQISFYMYRAFEKESFSMNHQTNTYSILEF